MKISTASEARFFEQVTVTPGCWYWTGSMTATGYGLHVGRGAHRWSYAHFVADIPKGLVIDHMSHEAETCHLGIECPHRSCVNPAHLQAITQAENVRRSLANYNGTLGVVLERCRKNLHALTGPNAYRDSAGNRRCRMCRRASQATYRATTLKAS